MRTILMSLLAVAFMPASASALSYATGDCATGGCATGEKFLASNANEVMAGVTALESPRDPAADIQTLSSPFKAVTDDGKCFFAVTRSGGGKIKTVCQKRLVTNLTEAEGYGDWIEIVGGGDTDVSARHTLLYGTGGSQQSSDEGYQIHRSVVQDYGSTPQGVINGAISSATGEITIDTTNSISADESLYMGQNKLMVFTDSAVTVQIDTLPPGALDSGGTEVAGHGSGPKTWTLADASAASAGWCFSAASSEYTDNNSFAVSPWFYITATTATTIDTEWISQGTDYGIPRFLRADTGAAQGTLAPCVKITRPVFEIPDDLVVDQVVAQKASSFTIADGAAFIVPAYPSFRMSGMRVIMRQRMPSGNTGATFHSISDLTFPSYSQGWGLEIGYTGALSNLFYGTHARLAGMICKSGGCRWGTDYRYQDNFSDEGFGHLDFGATIFASGADMIVFDIEDVPSGASDLTFSSTNGWGERSDPFLQDSDIGGSVQAYDADLDDLADGSLSGSKVGTGISGGNISTGTVADARIASTLTRDSELRTYTIDVVGPSGACTEGDQWLDHTANKAYWCVDTAANTWYGIALVASP